MIRYALKCPEGHMFESWFQSAQAYEKLAAGGMVACAVCGAGGVEKALMAPVIGHAERARGTAPAPEPAPVAHPAAHPVAAPERPLSAPRSPAEQAMAELRRKIEESSEYVGKSFATEARAIHEGTAPERAIYGEARPEEARKLIEEGVPVAPLPFRPARRNN